jgi:hypothetical protein
MLRLLGCTIDATDSERLVQALRAEGSAPSLEAAAAVRWGSVYALSADTVEPDMEAALLNVVHGDTPGLT